MVFSIGSGTLIFTQGFGTLHIPEHPSTPVPLQFHRQMWLDGRIPRGHRVYQAQVKDDLEEEDLQDGVMSCEVLGLPKRGAGR